MPSSKNIQKEKKHCMASFGINFLTHPTQYKHWVMKVEDNIAWLGLNVSENETLGNGYQLKLNSYDLGVDIELNDAVQRIRFQHPSIRCVIMHSLNERVFCAGANIKMLGHSTHAHKVNFCKFTNETRNAIENATKHSNQTYLCAIQGSCAGGGYELALACDEIYMADDGSSTVSLPELPLLAVLPGTGGLTRLVDKRLVRKDRADFFCTTEEGMRGKRALEWGLVDQIVPASRFMELVTSRAKEIAAHTSAEIDAIGIELTPLNRSFSKDSIEYSHVSVTIDRVLNSATFTLYSNRTALPQDLTGVINAGSDFWPLLIARELDDAILHMRFNEEEIGTWILKTSGESTDVLKAESLLKTYGNNPVMKEIVLYLERTLKRIDVSARSLIAAIEPGSCFCGILAELALACDQSYMLLGQFEKDERPEAQIMLTEFNFGSLRMVNELTRLESRFYGRKDLLAKVKENILNLLDAETAEQLGLVTFTPDDMDWGDELRLAIESRAVFSPDALSGMEANLRFVGPETIESKIFSRLSAWQNWIFQRPNAVGQDGALVLYGSGERPKFQKSRV
jgi:benzoyl-CoA-dihydrodiol lyase